MKIKGVWRKGKNLHDYKKPNNPDTNEWYNLALEDIGIYWDLPNFDECKHYYFQLVDIDGDGASSEEGRGEFPLAATPDDIIDDHYKWRVAEKTNQFIYRSFGALTALSLGLAFLS